MNCLWWQRREDRKNPDKYYRVDRRTNWNVWRIIRWRHYGLIPRLCPDHGKPCPHMLSYVPMEKKRKRRLPPLFFRGRVKIGDE